MHPDARAARSIHYGDLADESARHRARAGSAPAACPATASPCRPTSTGRCWRSTSRACAQASSTCRSIPATRKPSSQFFFDDAKPRVIVCRPESLGIVATHRGDATVLTIDANGSGELRRPCAQRARRDSKRSMSRAGRPRGDPVHVGHDRPLEGRDAHASQPRVERARARRGLGLHARRRAAARAADLSRARPVRRRALRAAVGCAPALAAEVRCARRSIAVAAARDGDDGRADVLHAPARASRRSRATPAATIRLFVSGSAPLLPGDVRRVSRAHRAADPRALRHDRNRHDHVEPARRRACGGHRRPPAARHRGARRRAATARPCAPGVVGGVEVRGPNVFAGYWRMPEKTREEFTADGWFRTGDVGEWVAGGEAKDYLRLVGRAKDLIITGGLNVYPKEIEERIDALPGRRRVGGHRRARSGFRRSGHGGRRAGRRASRRRSSGDPVAARRRSRRSRCRSACMSSRNCRATRWARCRRTCCANASADVRADGGATAASYAAPR